MKNILKVGGIVFCVLTVFIWFMTGGQLFGQLADSMKSREDIERKFRDIGRYYPSPNLMDFYTKPQYSGDEPEESGYWYLRDDINYEESDDETFKLYIDIEHKEAYGTYYIWPKNKEISAKTYAIYMDETGLHLVEETEDEGVKERVESYRFACQYISVDYDYIKSLKMVKKDYSSVNVSTSYLIRYSLKPDSDIVQVVLENNPEFIHPEKATLTLSDGARLQVNFKSGDEEYSISSYVKFLYHK